MSLVVKGNVVALRAPTVPSRFRTPPWLTLGEDPRPTCTLVLGDGFSQGFLSACCATDIIRSKISDHFGPRVNADYIPVTRDRFIQHPLWTRDLWPLLVDEWNRTNPSNGRDFYLRLVKEPFNPDRVRGQWSFNTQTIAYELRCYLWHLFRCFEFRLHEHLEEIRSITATGSGASCCTCCYRDFAFLP